MLARVIMDRSIWAHSTCLTLVRMLWERQRLSFQTLEGDKHVRRATKHLASASAKTRRHPPRRDTTAHHLLCASRRSWLRAIETQHVLRNTRHARGDGVAGALIYARYNR